MKILNAAEMREVDRLTTARYGIPSLTLMENAGASVAEFIAQRWPKFAQRRIVVLCGKGNNGGDGFVVARHLLELGAKPEVYLFAAPDEMHGDAATNCNRWQEISAALQMVQTSGDLQNIKPALDAADIVVDALLGTGTRGAVAGFVAEAIEAVNKRRGSVRSAVVAVDIPSGLIADTGEALGACIQASYTVTFSAPKIGMILGTAGDAVGELTVRDIGSPPELIDAVGKSSVRWIDWREVSIFARPRRADGNKGSYGHALVVAGSVGKSGAAVLASWAALRMGAGLVTVATPEPVLPIVAAHTPEIMTEPLPATDAGTISLRSFEYERFDRLLKGKRALAIGPGLTTNVETQQFVRDVVAKRDVPIILDADGLNAFAGRAQELNNAARRDCVDAASRRDGAIAGLRNSGRAGAAAGSGSKIRGGLECDRDFERASNDCCRAGWAGVREFHGKSGNGHRRHGGCADGNARGRDRAIRHGGLGASAGVWCVFARARGRYRVCGDAARLR